jgi:hypothetical protein
MKSIAVAATLLIAACLWSPPSSAEDLVSGTDFLPACKAELMTISDVLPPTLRFCIPDGMTIAPAIGMTMAYLEAKPERRNESFVLLALEAFAQAWPCKRAK